LAKYLGLNVFQIHFLDPSEQVEHQISAAMHTVEGSSTWCLTIAILFGPQSLIPSPKGNPRNKLAQTYLTFTLLLKQNSIHEPDKFIMQVKGFEKDFYLSGYQEEQFKEIYDFVTDEVKYSFTNDFQNFIEGTEQRQRIFGFRFEQPPTEP